MKLKAVLNWILDLIVFIAGGLLYSVAVLMFLTQNEISPGGLTGIASVLNYLFDLPIGVMVFIMNIPLLIMAFIRFGGVFIVKTTIATAVISTILEVSGRFVPDFKIEPILAAVFGGLLMGFALSLYLIRGSTTGGVDIISKLINSKFPHITVGRIMLFADAIVVASAAIVYKNLESALYSVVALYASSRVMDMMLYGSDNGKIIYIITEEYGTVSEKIMLLVGRGVTFLDVTGAYTGENRKMIMCTVRRNEVASVCKLVREKDKKAFVVVAEAGEILGEGFKPNI